VRINQYFYKKL